MKTFTLFTLLICISNHLSAQISWSSPITVSNSNGLRPRIVLKDDKLPVILWGTDNGDVMVSRMVGSMFMSSGKINPSGIKAFTASWAGPDLASHGDTVYAVYKSSPEDTGHVYIKTSVNGGQTFTGPYRVDFMQTGKNRFPTVTTTDAGQPIVSYMGFDNNFMDAQWQVALSNNLGQTFGGNIPAGGHSGGDACDCCPGSVVSKGNNVAVLYRDNLNNLRETWSGISTDGGNSFTTGYAVDNSGWMINGCPSTGPDGFINGDSLYSTFMSASGGSGRVYFSSASLVSGQFISMPVPNSGSQNYPRISSSGTKAAICWIEQVSGSSKVYLTYTENLSSGTWKIPAQANNSGSDSYQTTDIVMDGNVIHLVWETTDGKIVYRKGTIQPNELTEQQGLKLTVYPNPVSAELRCEFSESPLSLSLSDHQGKIVKHFTDLSVSRSHSINVSELASGVYLLQASFKTGYTNRVIAIQH